MLRASRPRFLPQEAESIVRDGYGLDARCRSELESERDQNFLLDVVEGDSSSAVVLKIASSAESPSLLDFQNRALERLRDRDPELPVPRWRPTPSGESCAAVEDGRGSTFLCRLFDYLPGTPLVSMKPPSPDLLRELGRLLGRIDTALRGFSHEEDRRFLKWNVLEGRKVLEKALGLVEGDERRAILEGHLERFEEIAPRLEALEHGVIHNDANDHNVLVDGEGRLAGLLDFGDIVRSPVVSELANACAYAMLGDARPFAAARAVISGYHETRPLADEELAVLYSLISLRLAMSVAISAEQFRDEPEKEYLRVSEKPAWELLERLRDTSERLAHYGFRAACGKDPHPRTRAIAAYLDEADAASVLPWDLRTETTHVLDLSVGSTELPGLDVVDDVARFTRHVVSRLEGAGARVGVGRYDEARPIYRSIAFQSGDGEPRTIHLGIDLFVPAGIEVRAPLEGTVHSFAFNDAPLDYGPTVLLEHETDGGDRFVTLYGHLSLDSLEGLERGAKIARGEAFARVGSYPENGNWPPHLHFQIVVDRLDKEGDFPGVAAPSERDLWLGLSPDPARLLGLPETARAPREDSAAIRTERGARLSGALSLSYREPLHIVRGYGPYLYDVDAKPYLDMVNNVCHVGHCHPRVVRALSEQAAVLNTNTRYLHRNIVELARRLTSLLPEPLEVCFFVNSGSEANDLALRLARTHSRRKDTAVLDGSYHGNVTSLIEVSPYKFDGPGGEGAAPYVHKLDMPDGYRGAHRRSEPDYGRRYLDDARRLFERLASEGRPVGAVIAEAILSCGGQVVLPPGYLGELFRLVRAGGGVAIADEVQVGFGRVGSHFWAFESEGALPDIVTMGKPFGNGHPLGAVVTTREVARSFQTGMEYFNTFGGNPVSCAVGLAVLDVIEDEDLRENARVMGERLLEGLRELQKRHPIVGDVRGRGLFLGLEMVTDREKLTPAAEAATALVNRMKDEGVLLSTDGPLHNVIKIKPPLVFGEHEAELALEKLAKVLGEERFRI